LQVTDPVLAGTAAPVSGSVMVPDRSLARNAMLGSTGTPDFPTRALMPPP
jgi:hypothetical protein